MKEKANSIDYDVVYGEDCAAGLVEQLRGLRVVVATDDLLWSKYGSLFGDLTVILVGTRSMEERELREAFDSLPDFDVVVGLGGGMALEASMKRVPSISSTTAWRRLPKSGSSTARRSISGSCS